MSGEHVEVAIQIPHIHTQVRRSLGSIDKNRNTPFVGEGDNGLDWVDGTEGVGEVHQSDQLGSIRQ
jgi:hypothetical protein